jgi:hypothetical protein
VVQPRRRTPISLGPGRLILTGGYDAQEAAQNLVHFPRNELADLGLWYDQAREIKQWNALEEWSWASLNTLSKGNTKLGPADLAVLRRDLQLAKTFEFLTVLNDEREIERGREFGVTPGPSRSKYVQDLCAAAPTR